MDFTNFIWGLAILAAGIFVCVYGNLLFRFVLAIIGFVIGFSLVMALAGSAAEWLRWTLAIVAGGIGAVALYSLFKVSLYLAGGILGAVIVIVVLALFGQVGGSNTGIFSWILVLAGAGLVGFLGQRLGNMVVVFATALAGSALVIYGFARMFASNMGSSSTNPVLVLSGTFALVLFAVIALISGLAQYQMHTLRRRLLR